MLTNMVPPLIRYFGADINIASVRSVRKDFRDEATVSPNEITLSPEKELRISICFEPYEIPSILQDNSLNKKL